MERNTNSGGLVVQLGPLARVAAEEAARLRGWKCIGAASLAAAADAIAARRPEVALIAAALDAEPPHTFTEFTGTLAERAPELCLGFLYGRNEAELLESARRLPDTPFAAGVGARQIAFAFPGDADYICGARVQDARSLARTSDELADLIIGSADVLYLIGHSNGHEAGVEHVLLCRRPTEKVTEGLRAYPCYAGAECRSAAADCAVRSADLIRARIVVNVTCWGVSLVDFPFSASLSVGEGMLRHGGVLSLITTVRAARVSRADYLAIYYLLNAGLPAGAVALKANRIRLQRGEPAELLCFGDPLSRIQGSVMNLRAENRPGGGLTCRIPAGESCDVAVRIPFSPETTLVLEGEPPAAALAGDGVLYLTCPARTAARDLSFRRAKDVYPPPRSLRRLRQDLEYVGSFVRYCAGTSGSPPPEYLVRLKYAASLLDEMLDTWPVTELCKTRIAYAAQAEVVWRELLGCLGVVADAFLDALSELGHIGDRWAMSAVSGYYQFGALFPNACVCSYCGRSADEELLERPWTEAKRRSGVCETCGPVYEGDPHVARWLECQVEWPAGSRQNVMVQLDNPYDFAVPANGLFAVRAFDPRPNAVARAAAVSIDGSSSAALRGVIDVPPHLTPGVYNLGAAIVVGGAVSHLKRPIFITAVPVR